MKLGKKKLNVIIWVISIALLAVFIGLREAEIIGYGWSWLLLVLAFLAAIGVKYIQKRVDPESYQAGLKEMEVEEKAEDEISHIKIKRTWGGTICEFITAMLLIVSWILILHKHMLTDANDLKIGILLTILAVWFLVSAYFHKTMGFRPATVKQLQLGIYRKRALSIACAIFLMIGSLVPHTEELGKGVEWLLIAFGLVFVLLFASKYVISSIKQ